MESSPDHRLIKEKGSKLARNYLIDLCQVELFYKKTPKSELKWDCLVLEMVCQFLFHKPSLRSPKKVFCDNVFVCLQKCGILAFRQEAIMI